MDSKVNTNELAHFEDLWEKCEKLHAELINEGSSADLIDELTMKLSIYKAIDLKTEIPEKERQMVKSRTLGEILLTITQLSLKDNINVFEALLTAYRYRAIENYSIKYPV